MKQFYKKFCPSGDYLKQRNCPFWLHFQCRECHSIEPLSCFTKVIQNSSTFYMELKMYLRIFSCLACKVIRIGITGRIKTLMIFLQHWTTLSTGQDLARISTVQLSSSGVGAVHELRHLIRGGHSGAKIKKFSSSIKYIYKKCKICEPR